jgi:hypothetical protein
MDKLDGGSEWGWERTVRVMTIIGQGKDRPTGQEMLKSKPRPQESRTAISQSQPAFEFLDRDKTIVVFCDKCRRSPDTARALGRVSGIAVTHSRPGQQLPSGLLKATLLHPGHHLSQTIFFAFPTLSTFFSCCRSLLLQPQITQIAHFGPTHRPTMASFLEDLWGSVFTPGPTPTLVVATNATFAVLQAVLAILLLLTHSIHLAVLSALCGGLWWGINWFIAELQKAEKAEEEARRLRKRRTLREGSGKSDEADVEDDEDEEEEEDENEYDDETETELAARAAREQTPTGTISALRVRGGPQKILAVMQSAAAARRAGVLEADDADDASSSSVYIRGGPGKFAAMADAQAADAQAAAGADARGRRSGGENGESGSASTDSEWEKVSDR